MNVSVTSQRITATTTSTGITASVAGGTVTTAASGGIGPPGAAASRLTDLADVEIESVADGDLLRRDSGKWRNFPEKHLVIDGGNW